MNFTDFLEVRNKLMNLKSIKARFNENLVRFKPIPFWSWNDKLDSEELCRQIDWMYKNEIGGFFMHARGGLKTEYLSDEWMQCIRDCADYAEKLGMDAWIYDENGWPSGFVGGKLLEDPQNCDKYILYTQGAFDDNATVSYLLSENAIKRVNNGEIKGEYLNLFIHTSISTADILNPDVVDKFIDHTHEKYKQLFGKDFAKKIKGFFTDEPQYYRDKTPYTDMVEKYFKEEYKVDILDFLGLLFVEKEGYKLFRFRYWKAMQHLMLESFAKKLYNWCNENDMSFTGHYIEENSLSEQMLGCAGIMPFYKYMNMPGIDWLGNDANNETGIKQLASVAAQYGKKQTLTETYGCCGWELTPLNAKRIADFQFVNGTNMMCHHLLPYAEYGQRKKDHPAHYSDVNPWVKSEFKDFNLYFTRLGHLLSQSEEMVKVAVLNPIRSIYFDYKREDFSTVEKANNDFINDCRSLSKSAITYHILDETLLAEDGFVRGNEIGCKNCSYSYLVLPHIKVMDATTEKLLAQYVANGGKVLILGDVPAYLEGEPFDFDYLKSNCSFDELKNAQEFKINNDSSDIYTTLREIDGVKFLLAMNASTTKAQTQSFDFGEKINSFKKLDLVTLEEKNIPLKITLEPGESALLFLDEENPDSQPVMVEQTFALNNAEVLNASNKMIVDYVRYSKNGIDFSQKYPCPALFAKLLEERYKGEIYFKYEFEVKTAPSKIRLAVEKCNALKQWVNGKEFTFDEVSDIEKNIIISDITNLIKSGTNEYVVKTDWYQSDMVYYALFGENVTESLRNCLVYDSELEAIYLSGDFGVYPKNDYIDTKFNGFVLGDEFYIDVLPETVTEPVTDGFPFLSDKLKLRQKLILNDTNVKLRFNGGWQILKVTVNGKYAGKLVYERVLDISDFAVKGENVIDIEFVLSNRNLLGPHHLKDLDCYKSVSPWSFELTNSWVDGKSNDYTDKYTLIKLGCN